MGYKDIIYEVSQSIATITINRPEKLNATTTSSLDEILDAFDRIDANDEIRAAIITGSGRAFCAGADLSGGSRTFDSAARGHLSNEPRRDHGGLVTLRAFDLKKPIIAAINGPAVGIGITMTLPMDIRLASDTARMGFVFTRRGIVPEACSTWFLPRIVGIGKAMEWALSGRIFSAQEAFAGGLVSEVLPQEGLISRAREIALEIADNTSAVSVALTRQLFWKMLTADHPLEAHKLESLCVPWTGSHADAREGIQAFLEKRAPVFPLKPSSDMPPFYPWWNERAFE